MVTWKQFFLTQTKRERRMAWARPEDFVYKEATGNLGMGTGQHDELVSENSLCVCVLIQ